VQKGMTMVREEDIARTVERAVSARRFRHIRAVADLAGALASAHGRDAEQARRAALLHDYARERSLTQLLRDAEELRLPISDYERRNPGYLHGPLAAALAAREFDLDPESCAAIAGHTTGREGMGELELILFVADHAAEGRKGPNADRWRHEARADLELVAREMMDAQLVDSVREGWSIHPHLVEARNDLLDRLAGRAGGSSLS